MCSTSRRGYRSAYQNDTNEKKRAALLSPRSFYTFAVALLDELRAFHKKSFSVIQSTAEKTLLSQISQTNIFLLVVKNMFVSSVSLFFHDISEKRRTLFARGNDASRISLAWYMDTFRPSRKR